MRVLLLGATGHVGSRLILALLNHGHVVTAYVRSASKLRSAFPDDTISKITIVEGDAKSSATIKNAIIEHNCDAVVNAAGIAAALPWQHSDFPEIFKAVADAAVEVHSSGKKIRCWFMGGAGIMDYPGQKGKLLVDLQVLTSTDYVPSIHFPIYKEHVQDIKLLESLPEDSIAWSILCPGMMVPASKDGKVTTADSTTDLIASATELPEWKDYPVRYVPILGNALNVISNIKGETTLEANADFIARDLESGSGEYVRKKVGTKARAKAA